MCPTRAASSRIRFRHARCSVTYKERKGQEREVASIAHYATGGEPVSIAGLRGVRQESRRGSEEAAGGFRAGRGGAGRRDFAVGPFVFAGRRRSSWKAQSSRYGSRSLATMLRWPAREWRGLRRQVQVTIWWRDELSGGWVTFGFVALSDRAHLSPSCKRS